MHFLPRCEVCLMVILYVLYVACFLLPASLAALYFIFLMLARLLGARACIPAGPNTAHSFAIVIPAHDEESILAETLQSCAEIDYPKDKFQVYVIADNCSDHTAEIADSFGVTCLERFDNTRIGKGYALEWAFQQVLPSGCDAVLVLDADCRIDSHALRVFDRCLEGGDLALQSNYVMSNPDASAISYVARVGNMIEYELFYAPKSYLGLPAMLVGTGMVLRGELLEEQPWSAHSIVEDVEYTLALARRGIRVRFVANVNVLQDAAERLEQLKVQRSRWAGGAMKLSKTFALRLILEGAFKQRLLLMDFGWTLLILSRPLVLLHLLMTLVFAGILAFLVPGQMSVISLGLAVSLFCAYVVYFGTGIAMVGFSARRIRFLLSAPAVVVRLGVISLASLLRSRGIQWARTPR